MIDLFGREIDITIEHVCFNPKCNNLVKAYRKYCSQSCATTAMNNSEEGKKRNREKMIKYNKSKEHRDVARRLMKEFRENNPDKVKEITSNLVKVSTKANYRDTDKICIYLAVGKDFVKYGVAIDPISRIRILNRDIIIDKYWFSESLNIDEALNLEESIKLEFNNKTIDSKFKGFSEVLPIESLESVKNKLESIFKKPLEFNDYEFKVYNTTKHKQLLESSDSKRLTSEMSEDIV